MSGLSFVDNLRNTVNVLITNAVMPEQTFDFLINSFNTKLESLNATNLNGTSEQFRRIHNQYIQIIKESKTTVTSTYEIGNQLLRNVQAVFANNTTFETIQQAIAEPLRQIQTQLTPLQAKQSYLANQCAAIEHQYLSLLPLDTVAVPAEEKQ